MASSLSFVEYACGQMAKAGVVTFRKMFGEYAVYLDGKVVALVCDNTLFVKPIELGGQFAGEVEQAPPYSGVKPYFLIGDRREDPEWLGELVRITAKELPDPKPKKRVCRKSDSERRLVSGCLECKGGDRRVEPPVDSVEEVGVKPARSRF